MQISQDMLCHVNAPVIFPPPSLNGGYQEPITPGGYPGKTESFHLVFTRFRFPGSWEIHLFSRPRYTMRGLSVSLSRLFPVSNVPAFYEQFKFWPRSSDLKKREWPPATQARLRYTIFRLVNTSLHQVYQGKPRIPYLFE